MVEDIFLQVSEILKLKKIYTILSEFNSRMIGLFIGISKLTSIVFQYYQNFNSTYDLIICIPIKNNCINCDNLCEIKLIANVTF